MLKNNPGRQKGVVETGESRTAEVVPDEIEDGGGMIFKRDLLRLNIQEEHFQEE